MIELEEVASWSEGTGQELPREKRSCFGNTTAFFALLCTKNEVYEMISAKLKQLKDDCGMSNKELAEKSGVPLATVNRVMSGQGSTPNFQTVLDLVQAMNGSLDELVGLNVPAAAAVPATETAAAPASAESPAASTATASQTTAPEAPHNSPYIELLAEKDKAIEAKDQQLKEKEQWVVRLFVVCCVLMAVLIGVLVFDLVNPSIGFFTRRAITSTILTSSQIL